MARNPGRPQSLSDISQRNSYPRKVADATVTEAIAEAQQRAYSLPGNVKNSLRNIVNREVIQSFYQFIRYMSEARDYELRMLVDSNLVKLRAWTKPLRHLRWVPI